MSGARRRAAVAFAASALLAAIPAVAAEDAAALALPPPGSSRQVPLAAAETHRYRVDLEAGQLLVAVVEQQGIDLLVTVVDPAGEVLLELDSPVGDEGPERVSFLAATTGPHTLVVRALSPEAPPGSYRLHVTALRQPTEEDRRRLAAVALEAEAVGAARRRSRDSLETAASRYRGALEAWRALGDPERQAQALFGLGGVLRQLGRTDEALEALVEAAALWRQLGDRRGEADTYNQQGMVQRMAGDVEAAHHSYALAATLWRQLDKPSREARVLNNLGLLEHGAGRLDAAETAYLAALERFRQVGDRRRQAIVLNNLGGVADGRGEPVEAIRLYEQARQLAREIGDRAAEANAINNLGVAHQVLGEAWEASELYTRSLAVFRQLGDRRLAAVLDNLGSLSIVLGRPEEARRYLTESLALRDRMEDPRAEGGTLNNLGRAEVELGHPLKATALFRRALELRRRAGYRAGEAETLRHLGRLYLDLDEVRRALPLLTEAQALFQQLSDREGEGRLLVELGRAHRALGEPTAARQALDAALDRLQATGNRWSEASAHQEMARLELAADRPRDALTQAERALDLLDSLRYAAVADEQRRSFTARHGDAYELAIEAALTLDRSAPEGGYAERAFELAERARARSFVELLREARLDLGHGVDPQLLAAERALRGRVNALAARLAAAPADDPEPRARLDELLVAHRQARARIRAANPHAATLADPAPVAVSQLRELLGAETTLLEYALGRERSALWIVDADGLEVVELAPRWEIEEVAREAYRRLSTQTANRSDDASAALARLATLVLAPAGDRLRHGRLLVVADGALHYIPFGALPLPGGKPSLDGRAEPLIARHEVVALPSASALAELRERPARELAGGAVVVVADPVFGSGDPRVRHAERAPAAADGDDAERVAQEVGLAGFDRLPWTRVEAEAIAAVVPRRQLRLLTGFDADLTAVTAADLTAVRILHFATHGLLDSGNPELSGLVLSRVDRGGRPRPGFLRLDDVYQLDLDADLVVLSGCRTALGQEVRTEGLVGLARGFLYAGARQVMASLWSVQDRSTAELIGRFYRAVFEGGLAPAPALRAAQLSMWRDRRFADPYDWAAFILLGDGPEPPVRGEALEARHR